MTSALRDMFELGNTRLWALVLDSPLSIKADPLVPSFPPPVLAILLSRCLSPTHEPTFHLITGSSACDAGAL